MTIFGQV